MATLFVVRSYELISLLLFLSGIIYIYRNKHPVYVGIYLASSIGGGVLEWVFDSKYYFRLTSDDQFFAAWTLAGEKAPAAMILFYGFFFGIPLVILRSYRKHLERQIGSFGIYCVILMLGLLGTPAFECTNTSVFGIYKYHQKAEYLLWGMPYSNLWFGVLMMGLPYWALERTSILVELLPRTTLSRLEQQCLAAGVGFGAVITGFFVAASINGIWYVVAGDVWTESLRSF